MKIGSSISKIFIPIAILYGIISNMLSARDVVDFVLSTSSAIKCATIIKCEDKSTDPPLPAPSPKVSSLEMCMRALDFSKTNWRVDEESHHYIKLARENNETVDSCRLKMGLPTIKDELKNKEIQIISGYTNNKICEDSLNVFKNAFSSAPDKSIYVAEALKRGMTEQYCVNIFAKTSDQISPPTTNSQTSQLTQLTPLPKSISSNLDNNGFPIGTIQNDAVNYANLRSAPDSKSELLARLPNGLEVSILGLYASRQGTLWCKISVRGGQSGYVYEKLISSSCELSEAQSNRLRDIDLQKQREAQQFIQGFFGAVVNNMNKR